ncbi:MAG: response regulator [Bdellovibrionia bacterium]
MLRVLCIPIIPQTAQDAAMDPCFRLYKVMVDQMENIERRRSLLVIEDDETIRELLKTALEFEGHEVFDASNGAEGIRMLSKMPVPCLILLDLMMPVMDGWEFVERLSKDRVYSNIPVIVITAFCDIGRPIRAKEVVKKPIDLDYLFKVVRQYCFS